MQRSLFLSLSILPIFVFSFRRLFFVSSSNPHFPVVRNIAVVWRASRDRRNVYVAIKRRPIEREASVVRQPPTSSKQPSNMNVSCLLRNFCLLEIKSIFGIFFSIFYQVQCFDRVLEQINLLQAPKFSTTSKLVLLGAKDFLTVGLCWNAKQESFYTFLKANLVMLPARCRAI